MKPGPLTREKIGRVVLREVKGLKILWEDSEPKIVSTEDVKSAVEWLLQEIEKLDRVELEEFSDEKFDNLHDPEEVLAHAIDYFKHLVREAFRGVIERCDR